MAVNGSGRKQHGSVSDGGERNSAQPTHQLAAAPAQRHTNTLACKESQPRWQRGRPKRTVTKNHQVEKW